MAYSAHDIPGYQDPKAVARLLNEKDKRIAFLEAELAEAREALKEGYSLIQKAQGVLGYYLQPDGSDVDATINDLLVLLDGPKQREVEAFIRKALAGEGVRGE